MPKTETTDQQTSLDVPVYVVLLRRTICRLMSMVGLACKREEMLTVGKTTVYRSWADPNNPLKRSFVSLPEEADTNINADRKDHGM